MHFLQSGYSARTGPRRLPLQNVQVSRRFIGGGFVCGDHHTTMEIQREEFDLWNIALFP